MSQTWSIQDARSMMESQLKLGSKSEPYQRT